MPLNLLNVERLMSRLPIRDRDTGRVTYFHANPSQRKILTACQEASDKGQALWLIFLKARRLGVSTLIEAFMDCHCLSKPMARAMIVAQLAETGKELFDLATQFLDALPFRLPPHTQHLITFPHYGPKHEDWSSTLRRATAKTVISGRGLTLSALHMTEAAFYPGEESFVSLLNTVSNDPDNIVVIETTANGMEGPGEAYYNYWEAAIRGENGFIPIFLPWWDDPGCVLPAELAQDAPRDDYEKWLMREFKLGKDRIAWHRWALETKCGGSIYKWREEYPADPNEAFVSSGNPAFDMEDIDRAKRTKRKPLARGYIRMEGDEPVFHEGGDGSLVIWEYPDHDPEVHYFVGGDAAKGVHSGDFASLVGWNAETGDQAFRYAAKIGPESLSYVANAIGRWYNTAMINVELTGGWGYIVIRDLRDKYMYPNQYLWKSRDDRPDTKPRMSLSWETTDRSRQMLLHVFRTSLRRLEANIRDEVLIAQMSKCVMEMPWRWQVEHGHDDVLMAAMLGWIALSQYHVPHEGRSRKALLPIDNTQENPEGRLKWMSDPFSTAHGMLSMTGQEHIEKVLSPKRNKPDPLEGT